MASYKSWMSQCRNERNEKERSKPETYGRVQMQFCMYVMEPPASKLPFAVVNKRYQSSLPLKPKVSLEGAPTDHRPGTPLLRFAALFTPHVLLKPDP